MREMEELERAARALGCTLPSPYSALSFLALPVIPLRKPTDMGLVDVMAGALVGLKGTQRSPHNGF